MITGSVYSQQSDLLRYDKPASFFEDALPIGNGRMGGMVYGGIGKDRIPLNEATLWAGYPVDANILKKHGRSVPINHSSSNSKT
jgi:alpha-L-fucosidase 2